jgi:hypothetical protein
MVKREISRVLIVNLFMMMEKRVWTSLARNPLYFCFEGNGKHLFQVIH